MAFLHADAVGKKYGALTVLDALSFTVEKGEHLTLFASSGAGKSTLLRILARLDTKHTGTVTSQALALSLLMQDAPLFAYKTVKENILYPLTLRSRTTKNNEGPDESTRPETTARYREWIGLTGLAASENRYPHTLSGGMKQKVAIIRAFITDPDLVLLDEPFKSIDLKGKLAILRHIQSAYGQTTTLLVTHALEEIPLLTQRMLVFDGTPLSSYRSITISGNETIAELAPLLYPGGGEMANPTMVHKD